MHPTGHAEAASDVPDSFEDSSSAAAAGITAMEEALEQLEAATQNLAEAEDKVATYSELHQVSEQEYADVCSRLDRLERLMRSQRVRSSEELLAVAESHAARLEQFYEAEGMCWYALTQLKYYCMSV